MFEIVLLLTLIGLVLWFTIPEGRKVSSPKKSKVMAIPRPKQTGLELPCKTAEKWFHSGRR